MNRRCLDKGGGGVNGTKRAKNCEFALRWHPPAVCERYVTHTPKSWETPKKWAVWLHNLCRLGGPQRFRAGDKIGSGPRVGGLGHKGSITQECPKRGVGSEKEPFDFFLGTLALTLKKKRHSR